MSERSFGKVFRGHIHSTTTEVVLLLLPHFSFSSSAVCGPHFPPPPSQLDHLPCEFSRSLNNSPGIHAVNPQRPCPLYLHSAQPTKCHHFLSTLFLILLLFIHSFNPDPSPIINTDFRDATSWCLSCGWPLGWACTMPWWVIKWKTLPIKVGIQININIYIRNVFLIHHRQLRFSHFRGQLRL